MLKQEKTTEKTEVPEGKTAIIASHALCLTQPYSLAFTTTPNNWKKGLMGQVPTLGTPFRRNKTTIKGGGDPPPPKKTSGTRKSSSFHAEDQSFLENSVHPNLIVITVVHTSEPNSLAHSLQIYCIGLIGLRSHASWAWLEKRDPTETISISNNI